MKYSIAVSLLLGSTSAAQVEKKEEKKCIALALSGGGALGAYEAGALWGIYHTLTDKS